MMPQQNDDTAYQHDNANHIGQEQAQWEAMQHSEEAEGLHLSEERTANNQPTELDHEDADRRALDESQADEDADNEHYIHRILDDMKQFKYYIYSYLQLTTWPEKYITEDGSRQVQYCFPA